MSVRLSVRHACYFQSIRVIPHLLRHSSALIQKVMLASNQLLQHPIPRIICKVISELTRGIESFLLQLSIDRQQLYPCHMTSLLLFHICTAGTEGNVTFILFSVVTSQPRYISASFVSKYQNNYYTTSFRVSSLLMYQAPSSIRTYV